MNIGIVAEYNPFHNGHKYQIDKIREMHPSSNIIVVLSGNYTQRGNLSIVDKFTKTEMALSCGADLVIELPQLFQSASASYFSRQAVNILNKINIVDAICFGTENMNVDELRDISTFLLNEPISYKNSIKNHLKNGNSFPKSRSLALKEFSYNELSTPNNILGVEYMKTLITLESKIVPITINRTNNYHDSKIVGSISSATSIRENAHDIDLIKTAIPEDAFDIFYKSISKNSYNLNEMSKTFRYLFLTKDKEEILDIVDFTEDIYNRFYNIIKSEFLIDNIIEKMCCKNMTKTRIQRMVLSVLLDNKSSNIKLYDKNGYPFVRVLGFKKEKQQVLSDLIEKSDIKIVTNLKNANKILNKNELNLLNTDIKKSSLFHLCNENNNCFDVYDLENKIVII